MDRLEKEERLAEYEEDRKRRLEEDLAIAKKELYRIEREIQETKYYGTIWLIIFLAALMFIILS